jgi:hypothetical protein
MPYIIQLIDHEEKVVMQTQRDNLKDAFDACDAYGAAKYVRKKTRAGDWYTAPAGMGYQEGKRIWFACRNKKYKRVQICKPGFITGPEEKPIA